MNEIPKKMLADRILVKPLSEDYVSKGGLVIPDIAKEKPLKGTVVLTGPGLKDKPVSVNVGDTIMYGKYSGVDIVFGEEAYVIIRDVEITAIL